VLTAVAQTAYDSEREVLTTRDELERLRTAAKTKALIADIAWGATAAGAGVTAILLFTSGDDDKKKQKPGFDVGLGSVSYTASF
jgi:hypothetical protein